MSEKYLTKEGLIRLKKELERLKKEERQKVAKDLEEAISFGDLSENAAYDEAKECQALLEGKIVELENIINNAVVIKGNNHNNWVDIGSKVTVKWNNREDCFLIVGEEESSPIEKRISFKSPLGKALLKKERGTSVRVKTPSGDIEYMIVDIS
ncbi:MAG: transcription elongation factor GreA [Candidatus Pacebacteria bacterium]|nr:transcription elongation factor GreA [Candidatus Paceibacterota bacterium]MDD2796591.1 transcription elongation factor GreA [Candidatus Paceibacterota bacterium]MDD3047911.1 transcription elongation factor GreA [Candidatus Paceibacterota bacterium]MDD3510002.1 transcription elongation factor GreA [Candidatus Paceibacterota bacterium]MDD3918515.1 transcription elongation factor GreA [Candidatus Paceibacterota bacterium]